MSTISYNVDIISNIRNMGRPWAALTRAICLIDQCLDWIGLPGGLIRFNLDQIWQMHRYRFF